MPIENRGYGRLRLDHELGRLLRKQVNHKVASNSDCYKRCTKALEILQGPALYVEGLRQVFDMWVEHSWLVVEGSIVELEPDYGSVRGYEPVFVYERSEVAERMAESTQLPFFERTPELAAAMYTAVRRKNHF